PPGTRPLQCRGVREARCLCIDMQLSVGRVMAVPAMAPPRLLPHPGFGASEKHSKAAAADLERAKKLMAEAGYPNGFTMSLGSPAGRYTNDQRIAQVVAAMWARLGVKVDVDTMAPAVFFKQRNAFAFSAYLAGWAASSGEMLNPLNSLV